MSKVFWGIKDKKGRIITINDSSRGRVPLLFSSRKGVQDDIAAEHINGERPVRVIIQRLS